MSIFTQVNVFDNKIRIETKEGDEISILDIDGKISIIYLELNKDVEPSVLGGKPRKNYTEHVLIKNGEVQELPVFHEKVLAMKALVDSVTGLAGDIKGSVDRMETKI